MPSTLQLRAGAAMVDITPKAGTHLSGSGAGVHRPAQSVLDPLYAKAAVFECGDRKLCLLALDLCIITEEFTARIREAAADRFGFDPEAVMVHAIQTHSAPSCGRFMLDRDFPLETSPETEYLTGSESAYTEFAAQRAIEAIGQANATLEPVEIGAGSGICGHLAFNRRGVARDGTIVMPWPQGHRQQPLGPTELRCLEGPIDPEAGVFCARTEDMRMITMLLHYTCHPVNLFGTKSSFRAVSADWPGAWAAGMQAAYGKSCVPLVLNGCCGDINPWDPFDPDFVLDHKRMGTGLAAMAGKIVPSITFTDSTALDWRTRRVPLGYRNVPAERLEEVERILSENPQPKWREDGSDVEPEWFHAASTKSIEYCRRRMPEFLYEIQAMRIGDAAFVGLPGEPFVEGQLAIKIQSPAYPTYVAHGISHYAGYVPTKKAATRGGHEANAKCTYWAKLAPEALDVIVENAVEMLHELFNE